MEFPVINSRADLDAISGTDAHAAFMAALAGTLWRLERDDAAKTWRAVQDNTAIERFGMTRADFPGAAAPSLPAYTPPPSSTPRAVSMRQARLALLQAGLLAGVNTAVAALPGLDGDAARVEWEYAQEVRRDSPLVANLASAMSLDAARLDELFLAASVL